MRETISTQVTTSPGSRKQTSDCKLAKEHIFKDEPSLRFLAKHSDMQILPFTTDKDTEIKNNIFRENDILRRNNVQFLKQLVLYLFSS